MFLNLIEQVSSSDTKRVDFVTKESEQINLFGVEPEIVISYVTLVGDPSSAKKFRRPGRARLGPALDQI